MKKPVLTKEQAQSMDAIIARIENPKEDLVFESRESVIQYKFGPYTFSVERSAANTMSNDDFIAALYLGYEIEKTPHEKLREYYGNLDRRPLAVTSYDWYEARGIERALAILGIKVEGVNA